MLTQRFPGTRRPTRKLPGFRTQPAKIKALPPEASPWWWNPGRPGVLGPPSWFEKELRDFDPELRVTWNAYDERWYVWVRKPSLVSKHCRGWLLLFPVRYTSSGDYMPLDGRIFARLYAASADQWGNGKRYFERITAEQDREKELRERSRADSVGWHARDYFKHLQPSVSMVGQSNGSKFADNCS